MGSEKRKFRVERTELHTRVWEVLALDEDEARETYFEEDDDENQSYHSGDVEVSVSVVGEPGETDGQ